MTAVAIAALTLAAGMMGLVLWLVPKVVKKTEGGADVAIALASTEAELERVTGERDRTADRLAEAEDMAEHLAEELRDEKSQPSAAVGAGLAADDVRGRGLRLYDKYKARSGARNDALRYRADPVLSEGGSGVAPGRPAAGAADPGDG